MTTSIEPSVTAAVQTAIAAYAQALDGDRPDDIAALFTPDGVAEITGMAKFEGREAIRQGFAGFAPQRPQLHLVANTVVTSATEDEVTATSNLAFFGRGEAGWSVELVGRYDDVLRRHEGEWRFQQRTTTFLP
ncbi:nuclear transport factor 2 family protein [Streptomyces sp. NPDC101776]|uniref:nuclear transport factor 2 family protein n=1 Tax=Streptomyces sp. NPDC101776 TaxID=3366146 RepID=UPI00382B622D